MANIVTVSSWKNDHQVAELGITDPRLVEWIQDQKKDTRVTAVTIDEYSSEGKHIREVCTLI